MTSNYKYYIDSSENPSSNPEDALDGPYAVLENAQEQARIFATGKPGVEFYVNRVTTSIVQVYRAESVISLETEVLDASQ